MLSMIVLRVIYMRSRRRREGRRKATVIHPTASPNAVAETGECGLAVTFMAIAYDGTLRVLKNYSNNSSERRMRRQAQQNSLAETALHSALLPLTIEQPKFCPEITDN